MTKQEFINNMVSGKYAKVEYNGITLIGGTIAYEVYEVYNKTGESEDLLILANSEVIIE